MAGQTSPLHLLPRSSLVCTGPVDHPGWNYRPLLGSVQRLRFRIARRLLGVTPVDRLLELGYGSGVFMPELAGHCRELHGVDPHPMAEQVQAALATHGVEAVLRQATVESLPYPDHYFDRIVTVSTLEYAPDLWVACRELVRVLAPDGALVVVTPGAGRLWNLPLRLLTRQGPSQYGDRRTRLPRVLRHHFHTDKQIRVPPFGGNAVRLYTGLRLRPRRSGHPEGGVDV